MVGHALTELEQCPAHVIVLDVMMPGMDGYAFRAEQLLRPRLAEIPVIVISAKFDLIRDVRALRPHACLSKPFDVDEMLATVSAVSVAAA